MAVVLDGSSQYLSGASTLLTNEPIDMVIYGYCGSSTAYQVALNLGNGGGASGNYDVVWAGSAGGDPISCLKQTDGAVNGQADTSSGYSTNTWFLGASTFISNTSRAAFINGGSKGTNTTSITDPTPDNIAIGASLNSSASVYFNGRLAEAYVISANMTDGQHGTAGKGVSPFWLVPASKIRGWYHCFNNPNNSVTTTGNYPHLTATGSPTYTSHPANVMYPRINGVIGL